MTASALRSVWSNPIANTVTDSNAIVELLSEYLPEKKGDNVFLVNTDSLDQTVKDVIGDNGVKRFEEFKKYKYGWDNGKGEALTLRSVAVMEYFINSYHNFLIEPSIFLTREGNLQLGWEDKNGKSLELEFFPERIEYYIESTGKEDVVSVSESGLRSLISELKSK